MSSARNSQLALEPKEAYRLFRTAANLAETLEDILEAHGSYSQEFLKGLRASIKEARAGRLKRIVSLKAVK